MLFFCKTDRTQIMGSGSLAMSGSKKMTRRLLRPPMISAIRNSPTRFPGSDLIQDQSRSSKSPPGRPVKLRPARTLA